jgi:hypothetical protein
MTAFTVSPVELTLAWPKDSAWQPLGFLPAYPHLFNQSYHNIAISRSQKLQSADARGGFLSLLSRQSSAVHDPGQGPAHPALVLLLEAACWGDAVKRVFTECAVESANLVRLAVSGYAMPYGRNVAAGECAAERSNPGCRVSVVESSRS